MGAWSHKPFGNDDALDWASDLALLPQESWRAHVTAALEDFESFETRRSLGMNFEIRTPEEARYLIGLLEAPDEEITQLIMAGVGREYEDMGDGQTLTLIAASHVLLSALTEDRTALPDELRGASFDCIRPVEPLARQAAALLALVPANRSLCREYGPTWKRGVAALADRLRDSARRDSAGPD